jgi:uncharacterized protein (TIGR03066 family)
MRILLAGAMAAMFTLVAGAGADDKKTDKIDGKKLVGKWEPSEAKADPKIVIEFTKDGKLNFLAGKDVKYAGTYKLDGNKLSFTIKAGENEVTKMVTVLKLTDDIMEAEGEMGKKTMKRIKEK